MGDREPNLVTSGLSRTVTVKGEPLSLEIYRLEDQSFWTLEVVNSNGTSTVWDDEFDTDDEADKSFQSTLVKEGVEAFLDSATVIPFRR